MKCISVCLKSTDCQEFMRKPIVLISLLIFPEFSREVFHNILYHEINSSLISMVPNFTALISAGLKSQTTWRNKSLEHWFSNWLHTNYLGNLKKSWCLRPPFQVGNFHPTQEFGSFYCHPQPSWPQSVGVRRDPHAWGKTTPLQGWGFHVLPERWWKAKMKDKNTCVIRIMHLLKKCSKYLSKSQNNPRFCGVS